MKSITKRIWLCAALLGANLASAASVFEVTTDGQATAFYLEAGVVEVGGNFLYIEVTTPDGKHESLKTSCFPLVDDKGCIFPWKYYGELVPANARAYVVLPRVWPKGTRFEVILLDRDGAELKRAIYQK